jgi:hypothetical protein
MIRKSLVCALASTMSLAFASRLDAAALQGAMHESFDYADTTQFVNPAGPNGGQGWNPNGIANANFAAANWGFNINGGTAPFRTATSPGLTSSATGYLAGTGNKLTLDASSATQNTGRLLGTQVIDSGTTYFSMLLSKSNDTIRTMNFAFFGGSSGTAAGTERFALGQVGATAGNSGGNIALLMNNSNPAGLIQSTTSPIAMGVGVSHLIVGRIDWNAAGFETVSIWVDPADVTTEAAAGAAYLSTNAFELTSINAIRPFAGNSASVGGGTVPGIVANFDEVRLGSSWELVTSLPVPVPEPSSACLAGLLGLVATAIRRKK